MNIYKVTLFGHRNLYAYREVEERLYPILRDLIQTKECVEIYIGRNGEFDIFAASIVKKLQKSFGKEKIGMTLILPYPQKDMEYYEQYYDSIMIPEPIESTHPKGAITRRNEWMIEQCDFFICYAKHKNGGTYNALKYARKLEKKILNLAIEEL